MAINSGEYKSTIGLSDLYVALVTADSAAAYTADAPVYFAPGCAASHKVKTNTKTQYADDAAFDVFSSEGETEIELEVTAIPLAILEMVLGKYLLDAYGVLVDHGGTPPDMALLFKAKKSTGNYRYYCYLKGKFTTPDEEQSTMADSPDPKTIKIKFTAIKTIHTFTMGDVTDGCKRVVGDGDINAFNSAVWFTQVQTPENVINNSPSASPSKSPSASESASESARPSAPE